MRKRAQRDPNSRLHVICPFCGYSVHHLTSMKWCANCYVQFDVTASGAVWFDTTLKRPEYAWAIAIAKSGGARIGPPDLAKGATDDTVDDTQRSGD